MLRLAALLLLADVSAAFGAVMASQRPVLQPLLGTTTTHFTPRHPVPALSSLAPARALVLRGGAGVLSRLPASLNPASPDGLFNVLFLGLATFCAALVVAARDSQTAEEKAAAPKAGPNVRALQWRFLLVFWLYKMADWLQGPYFYEVYASKVINGIQVSTQGVARLFLTGFGSTALFGALVGGLVDSVGRKRGSIAFALFYILSALSTRSNSLGLLFAGRLAGGIGTSLLFSAPEAWLISEHQRSGFDPKWLSQTFGLAYFVDSLVAIGAGLLAGTVASVRGPAGPFELSCVFLLAGAGVVLSTWKENVGGKVDASKAEGGGGTDGAAIVKEAVGEMRRDKRILLVGAVQALFEGAMYIFVLQWPPAFKAALAGSVPFGKVFACFMVCCMTGSTTFSALIKRGLKPEDLMAGMLAVAAIAMGGATAFCGSGIGALVGAFFAFEACVGMYFPLIGTLRSRYVPDAYRGVIMNLFGIPLNLIVCAVFLSIGRLGLSGAFACSALALSGAFVSSLALRIAAAKGEKGS